MKKIDTPRLNLKQRLNPQNKIVSKIKKYETDSKYKKIHIVINPASGSNEPVINMINTVFSKYKIDWDVSITHKFGDATRQARKAAKSGVDLVMGYGGDGTQHEIINGVYGTGVTMGILPGGTGNGFSAGLGLPKTLEAALELVCTSDMIAKVDIASLEVTNEDKNIKAKDKINFLSRLYVGVEPDDQTSRELKDKYGLFAYAVTAFEKKEKKPLVQYKITMDGNEINKEGVKLYVVNSASTGIDIPIGNSLPTDGILDVFLLDERIASYVAAAERAVSKSGDFEGINYWSGKDIKIETTPNQAVWADGEYVGRTPIDIKVIHQAVNIVVPK